MTTRTTECDNCGRTIQVRVDEGTPCPPRPDRPPTARERGLARIIVLVLAGLASWAGGYFMLRGFLVMFAWEWLSGRELGPAEILPFHDVFNAIMAGVVAVTSGICGLILAIGWLRWALTTGPGKPDGDVGGEDWP